ncbi:MAG: type 4a pilus biogenesis protein PilO [Planctomycetaceae bacterium]|nr:type 4a pilus biogenesis protein PilO [Planctomycetaceae bacterium]
MKDSLKRDNLLTIVGTVLTIGFFVMVVHLPGERACQAARSEITVANRTIDAAPMLMMEASQHEQTRGKRLAALRQLDRLLDDENELHGVVQKVANLAHSAGLKMDRIQPQPAINRETYRVVPFQVTISGSFRRIAQFLHGLESQPTLFSVERFNVKCETEQASEALKADLTFSVFVKRASFAGFDEKNDSSNQTKADDS